MNIVIWIACAVVLGGFFGVFLPEKALAISVIGKLFLNGLKAIVIPLVMISIVNSVASLGDAKKLGRMGGITFLYFLISTVIALGIGVSVGLVMSPGEGFLFDGDFSALKLDASSFSLETTIMGIVPSNFFKSMVDGKILPLIFVSILFGLAMTKVKDLSGSLGSLIKDLDKVLMKLVDYLIVISPLGIFSLVATRVGTAILSETFLQELEHLGRYVMTVILGLGIHALVVIPLVLWLVGKKNPLRYFWGMGDALMTALGTSSSSATLPVTFEALEKNNQMNPNTTSFVLPLGATVNMDGTALYQAVSVIFIAQAYGTNLGISELLLIILTATLSSIGTAGIPQAGLMTLVLVLQSVGLPPEGITFILAVDWLVDRARTVVNVWSDSAGVAVVDRFSRLQ